jgi:hypothetical protein
METWLYIQTARNKLHGVIRSVPHRMFLQHGARSYRLKSDMELLQPIPAFNIYLYWCSRDLLHSTLQRQRKNPRD